MDEGQIAANELRVTCVKLRIVWDPTQQDHPAGWDFARLLDMADDEVQLTDFEDREP